MLHPNYNKLGRATAANLVQRSMYIEERANLTEIALHDTLDSRADDLLDAADELRRLNEIRDSEELFREYLRKVIDGAGFSPTDMYWHMLSLLVEETV